MTDTAWTTVAGLAETLVDAWGAWAPMLTADGSRVAFVADRSGIPQLHVMNVADAAEPTLLTLSPDPVVRVGWSPDDEWISCSVATGGGVRTEVWVVRPDGTDAQRVAGGEDEGHAVLGPWAREGNTLVVTLCPDANDTVEGRRQHECVRIDPLTGKRDVIAVGELIDMLDLSADGRWGLLRDGTRGAQFCRLVDRRADSDYPVLPYAETGATDVGLLRPAPPARPGERPAVMAVYLVTDAGLSRRELVAVGVDEVGRRVAAGSIAARDDAELEFADADAAGERVLLVWNVGGRSEVEIVETATGERCPCERLPAEVVAGAVLARDGRSAVLSLEGPTAPRQLWRLDANTLQWRAITPTSLRTRATLVVPELVEFEAHDGLKLTAWLYRARPPGDQLPPGDADLRLPPGDADLRLPPGDADLRLPPGDADLRLPPGDADLRLPPAMISLHGGPEAQERPVFTPQHQVLVNAGISVLAPNIRGSSGYGRAFVHADDRWGRFDAIRDVADCARMLAERGLADPSRIAVTGRSYGGYATLMALVRHAPAFAAGVDICGMSDLLTFYRDTEPWIAAAATTKYGDPIRDAALLAEVSPLHAAEAITVPLLVVHGELDTNVPLTEATQVVARLRELGRPVEYLELAGEGHEYRRADSRLLLLRTLTEFLTTVLAPPH